MVRVFSTPLISLLFRFKCKQCTTFLGWGGRTEKTRRQELIVNLNWLLRNHEHFSTYLFDQKLNREMITRNLYNLCLCLVYFFLYNGTSLEYRLHSAYFKLNMLAQGGRIICIAEVPASRLCWDVNYCE